MMIDSIFMTYYVIAIVVLLAIKMYYNFMDKTPTSDYMYFFIGSVALSFLVAVPSHIIYHIWVR